MTDCTPKELIQPNFTDNDLPTDILRDATNTLITRAVEAKLGALLE